MPKPFRQFSAWLEEAKKHPAIAEPTAMSLSTVGMEGQPSLRMVLLKEIDARGFVFYTNMHSRKSRELLVNPKAALCFYWQPLGRQVRVEGVAERMSDEAADAYFASRLRESQLGAWASRQSEPLASREELTQAFKAVEATYANREVPRPPHWSGWRIVPTRIEFWQQGDFRLHERELYIREGSGWEVTRLYP